MLSAGNDNGNYTSKIFDAGDDSTWNNLSFQGNEPSIEFLYAVDGQADIWRSADGVTWNLIKDDYTGADGNGATYMSKNSSGTLFILYNQDLWVSYDEGVSWIKINDDFNPGFGNSGLVLGIDDNDYIYIIDGADKVFRSTDGGISFSTINDSFGEGPNAGALTIEGSGDIYVIDNAANVFESTDSGVSFTKINDDYNGGKGNDINDMDVDSSGDLFALHNQDVWESENSGVNWTLINDDYNGGPDSNSGLVIYIDESDNIYIADGSEDIYESTNSGLNFSLLASNINGGNGNIFGISSLLLQTSLSFEVRNCSLSDCSDGTWQNVNLDNMNLEGRYFQYKVILSSPDSSVSPSPSLESISINFDLINQAPEISIIEPQNQLYTTNESLNLNYSVTDNDGNLETCWYNIDGGTNISLINCSDTIFNTSEGSHTLTLYANDSLGLINSDSVNFDVDPTGVSITIIEPTGTKTSRTGIPLTYSVIGNDLTCSYNVKTSIGGSVIENTTLANCSNSSFSVSTDGDYILNLFINNSFGSNDLDNSSFSVDTSTTPPSSGGGGGGGGGGSKTTIITQNGTIELSVGGIQNLIVEPSDVKGITWEVKNTGTNFLNDCIIKGENGYASWISSSEIKNLGAGEEYDFTFDLIIPETAVAGEYTLTLSLTCKEISEFSSFVAEIIEKKLLFNLIKFDRETEDNVKVKYYLEELSGNNQDVGLQFLLFGPNNEELAEVTDTKEILANSKNEYEVLIPVEPTLEGELNLLVNLNSETFSGFAQENILLGGAPLEGFAIFEGDVNTDNISVAIVVILFLVFAFFIVRRIIKHRKKLGPTNIKSKKKDNLKGKEKLKQKNSK